MTNDKGSPPQVGPVKAIVIKVLRGTIALLETAVTKLETPPAPGSGGKISNLPGWVKATVLATLALVTVWGVTALFPGQPAPEVALGGAGDQGSRGALEQGTRGALEQGSRGAGELLSRGALEQGTPSLPVAESPGPVSPALSQGLSEAEGEVEGEAEGEVEPSLPVAESPGPMSEVEPSLPVAESPGPSETATPSPETLPEPELQLTPEQVLIAAIESQVQNVTSKLGNGLIRSIQADFVRSKLVVLLNNEWYNLTSDRQDQLASEMLVEARGLDFQTLEITDSERHLLARSPVVGSGMIILRRSLPPNT